MASFHDLNDEGTAAQLLIALGHSQPFLVGSTNYHAKVTEMITKRIKRTKIAAVLVPIPTPPAYAMFISPSRMNFITV
jgi:hypothetical protein